MGEPRGKHHLQINEIFKSIQGEGRLQGELTTFIRVSGCNLRCSWCDTTYAYDAGVELDIDEITAGVERLDCPNVCLTGGEPLLQEHAQDLIDALKSAGCFIAVETNGTVDIGRFANVDRFVVDYKLPGAKSDVVFCQHNFAVLGDEDELKFVVNDRADYEAAKQIIRDYHTTAAKLMSPCWEAGIVRDLADWIVRDNLPVRYSLQINKAIWGGETKSK